MPNAPTPPIDRYIRLIEEMLAKPPVSGFVPEAESDSAVQVERGLILPMAMAGAAPAEIDKVIGPLLMPGASGARIVDAVGQSRPAFPGLLVHAWRRAVELTGCQPPPDGWSTRLSEPSEDPVRHAWSGLAMRDDRVSETRTAQRPTGAFLPENPAEHPESYWYRELSLLQAVATHGHLHRDAHALAAADRAAVYHLRETQPDHATAEPWGLLAFIHNPETHLLADQLLHTVQVQQPAGPRGVTRILLADTLLCLRNPPAMPAR